MNKVLMDETGVLTVMCPKCLREVAALERCPICEESLKDEKGLFMEPMEMMGFAEEFLCNG